VPRRIVGAQSIPRGSRAGNIRRALDYRHFIEGLKRNCLSADVSAQALTFS
jgi:hypothetical protein